jgi:hypothetical protein
VVNQAIELHDSTVEAIRWVGASALLTMKVYVHSSAGRPGRDAGVGCYQGAEVTVLRADLKQSPEGSVLDVHDGSVRMCQETFQNLLPLPCDVELPVELVLTGPQGSLQVSGAGMRANLTGEPGRIEEFRP